MSSKKIIIASLIGIIAIGSLAYVSFLVLSPTPTPYKQWLENPSLDSPIEPTWFWTLGTEGDNSDIEGIADLNQANFRVLGERKTVTLVSGTPNGLTSPGWGIFNNSAFLLPDDTEIRSYGCWTYHFLDETFGPGQVHNFPSVHFKKNVSMSVDMSDYVITDASLEVSFNASVNVDVDSYHDWNPNASTSYIDSDKFLIGDSANFYVELSDVNYSYPFRVANFETRDVALGQGDPGRGYPEILNITDGELNYVEKQDLIAALNTALESDKQNFTINLGLDIYCEDNRASPGDQDEWYYLIFKSCNLTITYEKKIDFFTSLSLNQVGKAITGRNIRISGAKLNFKYKINDTWPTTAPFSEIRIYLNNKIYDRETIKLSSANTLFQEAKLGGFDVIDFIDLNTDINLSIQLYLADTFKLEKNIEISIDDITLYIDIEEFGENWTPLIIGLAIAIIGLASAFILYFRIYQFPPLVRKIRKLKNKIRKGKRTKLLVLNKRVEIINKNFQNTIGILNLGTISIEKANYLKDNIKFNEFNQIKKEEDNSL